jgi:hypothetical protein
MTYWCLISLTRCSQLVDINISFRFINFNSKLSNVSISSSIPGSSVSPYLQKRQQSPLMSYQMSLEIYNI